VNDNPPFGKYLDCLDGHQLYFRQIAPGNQIVAPAIVDNLNHAVCGNLNTVNVYFFHPPINSREKAAFDVIVDHFRPDFAEAELPPPPDWVEEVTSTLPHLSEIERQIQDFERQISSFQASVNHKIEEKQAIMKWADLLWLDGIALQQRVREAFEFLGFHTESPNPTGHMHDLEILHGPNKFFAEITGSVGSIKIDKGRELMQWIIDAPAPEKINGVLIGNAFRKIKPSERPPTPDHKIFTADLEQFAKLRGLALLDVRQIYDILVAKLHGRSPDLEAVSQAMRQRGVVTLPIPKG
jgi:hypothetical protein